MNTKPPSAGLEAAIERLVKANRDHEAVFPGESTVRQPVPTVYAGAHLFKAETAGTLGSVALRTLQTYAPNFVSLARGVGLPGVGSLLSESAHCGKSHVDGPWGQLASFEMYSVARDEGLMERWAGLGTIPRDEFMDGMSAAALRLR
jgi:hypothetical protein